METDPELIDNRKVAPGLEVVTHCCLNGDLSFAELTAAQIIFDILNA